LSQLSVRRSHSSHEQALGERRRRQLLAADLRFHGNSERAARL